MYRLSPPPHPDLVGPVWRSADDQSVYATWFAHAHNASAASASSSAGGGRGDVGNSGAGNGGAAPPIVLDYCQDVFAVLSGPPATAQFSVLDVRPDGTLAHRITGSRPLVAHLPGRSRRFAEFVDKLGLIRPKKKGRP